MKFGLVIFMAPVGGFFCCWSPERHITRSSALSASTGSRFETTSCFKNYSVAVGFCWFLVGPIVTRRKIQVGRKCFALHVWIFFSMPFCSEKLFIGSFGSWP